MMLFMNVSQMLLYEIMSMSVLYDLVRIILLIIFQIRLRFMTSCYGSLNVIKLLILV